jgi:hypothetical protein
MDRPKEQNVARFERGDSFQPRHRQLDNPQLADKMLRRSVTRSDIDAVLAHNEIVEVYEHHDRVRYVLLGEVAGRPLHVVVAEDDVINATVVLSVHEPDEEHGWDPTTGFRSRKEGER